MGDRKVRGMLSSSMVLSATPSPLYYASIALAPPLSPVPNENKSSFELWMYRSRLGERLVAAPCAAPFRTVGKAVLRE